MAAAPAWRAVKFANVDWAIKPYLRATSPHPGRAAAELAAAKALKEAPPEAVESGDRGR